MKTRLTLMLLTIVALLPQLAFAQGGPGFGGGVDDGGVCVPLDGGLTLLAAAGVGYGIKKYAASRKQPSKTDK